MTVIAARARDLKGQAERNGERDRPQHLDIIAGTRHSGYPRVTCP